jgi:hypothetical protein
MKTPGLLEQHGYESKYEPVLLVSNRGISPHYLRDIERHVFENKKLLLDNYNEYDYL